MTDPTEPLELHDAPPGGVLPDKPYEEAPYQVVLGVDVSLTGTGMAWLESPTGERLTHRIESPPRAGADEFHYAVGTIPKGEPVPLGVRLDRLCSDTTIAVGDLWKPKPMLAVIESGFSGGHGPAATKLGMASGAVLIALTRLYIPCVMVPPKTRAKFATGNGNADKDAVLLAAVEQFGYQDSDGFAVKPKDVSQAQWAKHYDRADALILAYIGAYLIGEGFDIPDFYLWPEQEDAIDKLPPWQDPAASDVNLELFPGEEPF